MGEIEIDSSNILIQDETFGAEAILFSEVDIDPPAKFRYPKETPTFTTYDNVFMWGDNNLFPQNLIKKLKKNSTISSAFDFQRRLIYNLGLIYGYETIEDRQRIFTEVVDSEIDNWLSSSNVVNFFSQAIFDWVVFKNVFYTFHLSKDRSKISILKPQKAAQCRLEKQSDDGRFKHIQIAADWERQYNSAYILKYPLLDEYFDTPYELSQKSGYAYAQHLKVGDFDSVGYAFAPWHSIIESGWLEVAAQIPIFKAKLLQNQISLKMVVKIPTYFWEIKFGAEWKSYSPEMKAQKKREVYAEFTKQLASPENSGKGFFVEYVYDPKSHEEFPSWKFEPLNHEISEGLFNQDAQEANAHIFQALGIPVSLIGNLPGRTGQGAGSGSDVREFYNLYLALTTFDEQILMKPLNFIANYNGWNERYGRTIKFKFRKSQILTLDKITPENRM